MAEILVSDFCECPPPLLIGGFFMRVLSWRLADTSDDRNWRLCDPGRLVFFVAKNKENKLSPVVERKIGWISLNPGHALSMADSVPFGPRPGDRDREVRDDLSCDHLGHR